MDVIDRVPMLGRSAARVRQEMQDTRAEHKSYIAQYGDDRPEIRDWKWESLRRHI
jgi:xylulose-5-phosphate/fructose-6-phosphate phosphoketolase